MIHTVKGFGVVSKAEVDVILELSCFFDDPADVGNLISHSSVFSKSSFHYISALAIVEENTFERQSGVAVVLTSKVTLGGHCRG